MIIYKYPLKNDQMVGIESLLEQAGVDLIFNGHSHIWTRFITKNGVNVLETSNVGNTYGAFDDKKSRTSSVPSAWNENDAYHALAEKWDISDYVLQDDPYGLTPQMPTISPLSGNPYIESNSVTAFSIFDTGTGIIDSYYYDTRNSQAGVVHFDSFSIFNQKPVTFDDVKESDWFFDSVTYATTNHIFKGISETSFGPHEQLTRGMVVTLLSRIDGTTGDEAPHFQDVSANDYFAYPIGWAQKHGIVNGVSETEFAPNTPITREDLAVILHRYAKYKGYETKESNALANMQDANLISDYALSPMDWAVSTQLISGKGGGTLDPKAYVTRAEAATILMRMLKSYR